MVYVFPEVVVPCPNCNTKMPKMMKNRTMSDEHILYIMTTKGPNVPTPLQKKNNKPTLSVQVIWTFQHTFLSNNGPNGGANPSAKEQKQKTHIISVQVMWMHHYTFLLSEILQIAVSIWITNFTFCKAWPERA